MNHGIKSKTREVERGETGERNRKEKLVGGEAEGWDSQRDSPSHSYQFLPRHTSQHVGHESQGARKELSTNPKSESGLCFHASHLPSGGKKFTSQTSPKLSPGAGAGACAELATYFSLRSSSPLRQAAEQPELQCTANRPPSSPP